MNLDRPVERHEDSIVLEELIEESKEIEKLNHGTDWKKYAAACISFNQKVAKMEVD